jgi:hypothetical protein
MLPLCPTVLAILFKVILYILLFKIGYMEWIKLISQLCEAIGLLREFQGIAILRFASLETGND